MLLNVANSYLSLYFIIIINTLFVVLIINNFLLRKLFESRKTPIFLQNTQIIFVLFTTLKVKKKIISQCSYLPIVAN